MRVIIDAPSLGGERAGVSDTESCRQLSIKIQTNNKLSLSKFAGGRLFDLFLPTASELRVVTKCRESRTWLVWWQNLVTTPTLLSEESPRPWPRMRSGWPRQRWTWTGRGKTIGSTWTSWGRGSGWTWWSSPRTSRFRTACSWRTQRWRAVTPRWSPDPGQRAGEERYGGVRVFASNRKQGEKKATLMWNWSGGSRMLCSFSASARRFTRHNTREPWVQLPETKPEGLFLSKLPFFLLRFAMKILKSNVCSCALKLCRGHLSATCVKWHVCERTWCAAQRCDQMRRRPADKLQTFKTSLREELVKAAVANCQFQTGLYLITCDLQSGLIGIESEMMH